MVKKLLSYLCCPVCKGKLELFNKILRCIKCSEEYKVENGIPILINLQKAPNYLIHQITYFEEEDKTRPMYSLEDWQKSYLERFYDAIPFKKNSVVFDIACGSGYMAVELAKKGYTVIASDLTINQLFKLQEVIKRQKINNLFLVCCSAESLPFKTGKADIVIENAILEHLPREGEAINEINRVTKKNAFLMISAPLAYKQIWPFLIPANIWHDKKIGHIRRYSKADLIKKFARFSLVKLYYTGHLPKFILFLISIAFKTKRFNKLSEVIDKKFIHIPYGGTVITAFFRK